jgi:predicted ATPase
VPEELLAALLGDAPELQPLKRVLVERAEGNPFFVEESVRTLVESGVLAGERGSYRVARPFEHTQVPATVQAVLAARIDRLPPEDKRLLQAAAVIGKDVPYVLLAAIAELPEDVLRQGLARLHAAEFLYETSLFPELEYTFKHALTHEVTYGSLLQERRRTLHARIAGAVEALYPDRRTEYAEVVGRHALHGEAWEQAATYLRLAGNRAAERSANHEAVALFEQALEALGHVPTSRATREQTLDVIFELRPVLFVLGEADRIFSYLAEAEAIARDLNDERRQGRVLASLANQYSQSGDHERAIELGQQALAVARALDDVSLRMAASVYLARASFRQGSYARTLELAGEVRSYLIGELAHERWTMVSPPGITARLLLAQAAIECGGFAAALAYADEAGQIAERIGSQLNQVIALWITAASYLRRGDLEEALPRLEQVVAIASERTMAFASTDLAADLGYAYVLAGRLDEAIPLLEDAAAQARSVRTMVYHRFSSLWLGEAYVQAGRVADARSSAVRVLDEWRAQHERGHEAWALRLLGEIAAHADTLEVEQAEAYYRQGLALSEELGMRPLAAHCHLGLGALYQHITRDEQARAELATAAEMYRAMEMTFWLAKAEAALAQVAS